MFGILIVCYLFMGGCGAGVLLTTSLLSLLFHARSGRSYEQTFVMRRLCTHGFVAGFVVLCLSALCLVCDLGRPDRMLNIFMRPTVSYLSVGAFVLLFALLVSGFLAAVNLFALPRFSSRVKKAAEVVCALLALCLMSYTGLYLWQMHAVPFWGSSLVPVLFVLSALSTGLSLVLSIAAFTRDAALINRAVWRMRVVHLVIVVFEAAALAGYIAWAFGNPYIARSLELLATGSLAHWFLLGAVGCGLVVPLVAESVALVSRLRFSSPICDALVLVGGFALRFCIVSAGLH